MKPGGKKETPEKFDLNAVCYRAYMLGGSNLFLKPLKIYRYRKNKEASGDVTFSIEDETVLSGKTGFALLFLEESFNEHLIPIVLPERTTSKEKATR